MSAIHHLIINYKLIHYLMISQLLVIVINNCIDIKNSYHI
jgi:hypothetical protein